MNYFWKNVTVKNLSAMNPNYKCYPKCENIKMCVANVLMQYIKKCIGPSRCHCKNSLDFEYQTY